MFWWKPSIWNEWKIENLCQGGSLQGYTVKHDEDGIGIVIKNIRDNVVVEFDDIEVGTYYLSSCDSRISYLFNYDDLSKFELNA